MYTAILEQIAYDLSKSLNTHLKYAVVGAVWSSASASLAEKARAKCASYPWIEVCPYCRALNDYQHYGLIFLIIIAGTSDTSNRPLHCGFEDSWILWFPI